MMRRVPTDFAMTSKPLHAVRLGIPLLLVLLTGCGGADLTPMGFLFGPRANPDLAAELSKVTYPKATPKGDDLDIVLIKRGGMAQFVNRTPHAYQNVQLWLNQQYLGQIKEIPIGDAGSVPLNTFINEHGEPYPVGGFLNPDKNFPIVLAELFVPAGGGEAPAPGMAAGRRYRLLVRNE